MLRRGGAVRVRSLLRNRVRGLVRMGVGGWVCFEFGRSFRVKKAWIRSSLLGGGEKRTENGGRKQDGRQVDEIYRQARRRPPRREPGRKKKRRKEKETNIVGGPPTLHKKLHVHVHVSISIRLYNTIHAPSWSPDSFLGHNPPKTETVCE